MSDVRKVAERLRPYFSYWEIAEWLCTPHPQLGGDLPVVVINSGNVAEVDKIIDGLDADGYHDDETLNNLSDWGQDFDRQ